MIDLAGFIKNVDRASRLAEAEGTTLHEALKKINSAEARLVQEKREEEYRKYNQDINNAIQKLASEGKPKLEFIDPKKLKYSYSEVNMSKAEKMAGNWDKYGKKPVIISSDGYVEDGVDIVEAAKIKNKWVRVLRMNYKHTEK